MRAVRDMPRANQNTNGAIEAWHLTLKKMIHRVIGAISARRLDRLLNALWEVLIPFFWYQSRTKAHGRVNNSRKEAIVMSSVQAATHHMTDSMVTFPNPLNPNFALCNSKSLLGVQFSVTDVFSKFPSCNCRWAEEGNMCKHQIKALLMKGVSGGVLVQQLGSRFGSSIAGISHLKPPAENIPVQSNMPHHRSTEPNLAAP